MNSRYSYSDELVVRQRVSTNRGLRKLAFVGAALKGTGKLLLSRPTWAAYSAYNSANDISNLNSNEYGNPYITGDGHRRSAGATALKTMGNLFYFIPGVGLVTGMAGSAALDSAAGMVQNKADKNWAEAQQSVQRSGIKPYTTANI